MKIQNCWSPLPPDFDLFPRPSKKHFKVFFSLKPSLHYKDIFSTLKTLKFIWNIAFRTNCYLTTSNPLFPFADFSDLFCDLILTTFIKSRANFTSSIKITAIFKTTSLLTQFQTSTEKTFNQIYTFPTLLIQHNSI